MLDKFHCVIRNIKMRYFPVSISVDALFFIEMRHENFNVLRLEWRSAFKGNFANILAGLIAKNVKIVNCFFVLRTFLT